ncbi:hypothetical protein PENDEC_c045G06739 [Penicillium decumbens]|uniref:Uncharacterized protein n=1 Tax=Penicillium decumbens TaxID=69771 RepID=A0A1V6NRG7_PENDC|nr:hypothetical protein PENDEC_c045G06739 [Penicillium decumbens]
MLDRTRRVL